MFERFTTQAREAVIDAQGEAKALKASRIEVVHLLLGVLAGAAGTPLGAVLSDAGLTIDDTRTEVARSRGGQALGDEDAAALRSIGIDLDAVRESLDATFGEDALDRAESAENTERRGWFGLKGTGHIPFTPGAKKAIELSLREALARKDGHIGAEHLLLGVVRGGDDDAAAVIARHLTPAELRVRVLALLDRAA